jgi:hypothetical protein
LTDTLPPDLAYANSAVPAEPDTLNGQTQIWDDITAGAGLMPGERMTVTFLATVGVGANLGLHVNTVTGTAQYPGGVLTDTDDATVEVIAPRVDLDKALFHHDRDAGVVTYRIVVTNTGPSTLDVLPLSDTYDPVYLSFLNANLVPTAPADDGRIDWSDLTAAAPNGYGINLAPGERFMITTTYAIVRDIVSTTNVAAVTNAIDVYGNPANDVEDRVTIYNRPTVVELVYFHVVPFPGYVLLEWQTAVEVDHYGFYVYRGTTDKLEDAVELSFVPAAGYGGGASYAFKDVTAVPGVSYIYWSVDVDTSGRSSVHSHDPVLVPQIEMPYRVYLPLFYNHR